MHSHHLIESIANIAYEANRVYCMGIGDDSNPCWEDAPRNIRQSLIDGVLNRIENPDNTPEQNHENWLKFKQRDGWVYGEVKDIEAKTHPCMVPYTELPEEQKIKDQFFMDIVDWAMEVYLGVEEE